jgi:HJR/Mrr/RecB family endonuclease
MSVELIIGSLPYDASSQTVSRFLWDWVVPESTRVIMDRDTGLSKGFGKATVASPEDAVIACRAANDASIDGRLFTISVARPPLGARIRPERSAARCVQDYVRVAASTPGAVLTFSTLQQELLHTLRKDSSTRDFWVTNSLLQLDPSSEQISDKTMTRKVARLVDVLAERPTLLADLHPQLFEHLIAALLTASGYQEVRLTVPSADGGVDIFATKNSGLGRALYIIQCKRYAPAHKITRPDVQMTFGVLAALPATGAAIVTTSSFTRPAREFLNEQQHKISGLEGRDLDNWLKATAQILSIDEASRSEPQR